MKECINHRIFETDLCKPVTDFLISMGYMVRSEVNDCDIVGIKGHELLIVELKKSLNVHLLVQAVKRQKIADLVYVAILKPKKVINNSKWKDTCHLLRRLELGLILVDFKDGDSIVEVILGAPTFQREKSINMSKKKREAVLKEVSGRNIDLNVGGSSRKKLVTAYREASIFIACCLAKHGSLTPKQLRELGTDPKKTSSALRDNHYGWFDRLSRGLYAISSKGREEIKLYSELTKFYNTKIENYHFK